MHILPAILVALSANLDNFAVGVSYGSRKITVSFAGNLIVAVITSIGTLVAMLFGGWLARYLPPETTNIAGALIMVAVGMGVILIDKRGRKRQISGPGPVGGEGDGRPAGARRADLMVCLQEPCRADLDNSGHISKYEAVLLGVALMINNMSVGVGAGVAGLNHWLTAAMVFGFSVLILWGGVTFGVRYTSRWLGDKAGPASGLLLIGLGIYELFTG